MQCPARQTSAHALIRIPTRRRFLMRRRRMLTLQRETPDLPAISAIRPGMPLLLQLLPLERQRLAWLATQPVRRLLAGRQAAEAMRACAKAAESVALIRGCWPRNFARAPASIRAAIRRVRTTCRSVCREVK